MWKRTIIIPTQDNDGKPLSGQIERIETEMLEIVGGYTVNDSRGVWTNGIGIYSESHRTYTLVSDGDTDTVLAERLPDWTRDLRQESLYTDLAEIDVQFVSPSRRAEATATAGSMV